MVVDMVGVLGNDCPTLAALAPVRHYGVGSWGVASVSGAARLCEARGTVADGASLIRPTFLRFSI